MKNSNVKLIRTAILAVIAVAAGVTCGCQHIEESSSAESTSSATTAAVTTTTPITDATTASTTEATTTPVSTAVNPLTGQAGYNENAVGKRPVAVMMNNIKAALPQYGIAQADILYELVVEGGITRLMCVYADASSMPDVCSVRSCRYYYPIIAAGMDAIYCHIGIEVTHAAQTVSRLGIDRLNGSDSQTYNLCYGRDPERLKTYATEHTAFLKGSEVANAISALGYREDVREQNAGSMFNFSDSVVTYDQASTEITFRHSTTYYSDFTYNAGEQVYYKEHSGSPHIDGKTGEQISFTNLFALFTSIYPMPENTYLMDIELEGGTGYYFTEGTYTPIIWEKASETSPIVITDANGNALDVNVGKSYIGFIGSQNLIIG